MSTFLFLCPTHRDYREIASLKLHAEHVFFFHDYASLALEELVASEPSDNVHINNPRAEIKWIIEKYGTCGIDGVVSTDDYPGSALASIVSTALHLPGVAPPVNLCCQHKYYSRLAQQALVPESVPKFALFGNEGNDRFLSGITYPAFVKPVKSFFSVGAQQVGSIDELFRLQEKSYLLTPFFSLFATLMNDYAGLDIGAPLLVEDFLRRVQVTLEGYVCQGAAHVMGIVDSFFYPQTLSFERFEYPSALPLCVQDKMAGIAKQVMEGIGFNDGMFNIEFMYDPMSEAIKIIEINPRMASQFADLYEKVDGFNSYRVLLDLALGKKPELKTRQGPHPIAASCVLRSFKNQQMLGVPTDTELERLQNRYPGIRIEILATEGRRLSQDMQDGYSFRYGVINIGGKNRSHILATLEDCHSNLSFEFSAV